MTKYNSIRIAILAILIMGWTACKIPEINSRAENKTVPELYLPGANTDSANIANTGWRNYFTDPYLVTLIDTALRNNQELHILFQEIAITRNEADVRKGEYLPFVSVGGGAGVDKAARYTNIGAMEANTEIKPGKEMPEPVPDFAIGARATWEVDIWHKLHNARKAAINRYLATAEGRNFVITNLVAEIANSYYELLALDNQLAIVNQNIEIQSNALRIVKLQKESARTTELAVRKFEAEVLSTTSLQYGIKQQIVEAENRINFLLGRFPQPVSRRVSSFDSAVPASLQTGLPAQLLANRPDIRQAEQELAAAKLDVQVARAQFYPSLSISAAAGFRAFNPAFLFETPASIAYSLAGDLMAPVINRYAIKAAYANANAKQLQAVYQYERTILNAYIEVVNQMANLNNMAKSFDTRSKQVDALTQSISIANDLFKSARADYMEVLLTQRDALEAKVELVETKKRQFTAMINIYRALGGGWQ